MHALFASVVIAALLLFSGRAQAAATTANDAAGAMAEHTGETPLSTPELDEPIGRCLEAPISLSFEIEAYEASRALSPEALTSPGSDAAVTPATPAAVHAPTAPTARAGRPFTPVPRACSDMRDPRCALNALPPAPERVELERSAHPAILPSPELPFIAAPLEVELTVPEIAYEGRALDAHGRSQWRPPRGA